AAEARFESLETQVRSLADTVRRSLGENNDRTDAVPELRLAVDTIEARSRATYLEQQRLEGDPRRPSLPPVADPAAFDAAEQQRAGRARLEGRLQGLEARLDDLAQVQARDAEERRLLHRRIAVQWEQLQELVSRVEAQRTTLLEHFRRQAAVTEAAG